MSDVQSKIELRKRLIDEIAALPAEYLSDSDECLFLRVTSLEEFTAARNIMVYCSVEREPDTHMIAQAALSTGKTVAFPYCYRGGIMQARIVRDLSELKPSMLGIPAPSDEAPMISPEELDLIIVPALAYDYSGYRVGYGGGYYDRYLSGVRAYTVGIARERLMMEKLPKEKHDVPVKCVITESEIRSI